MSITKYDSRLIQRPHEVPAAQRTFWGMVTLAFWALYLYLWIPLITLVAWFLGIRQGWIQLYRTENQIDPFVVVALPLICVVCAVLMITWGEYNRRRFRNKDRRSALPEASHAQVAGGLGAPAELGERLSQARIATIILDENARPIQMLERAPGPNPTL